MDRHRGDRFGDGGGRHPRMSSRWSDGPSFDQNHRYPNHARGGGGGRGDGFSGGRHHHHRGGPYDHPSGGAEGGRRPGFRPGPGGSNAFDDQPMPMGGARRGGFGGPGRGGSPNKDNFDGSKFVKLFIGAVPTTATEQDIRPFFEEHGHVIEVALIKDKRTGQQQGCCFVKYPTSEEAERAIRALHNQVTLPRGVGPIQVRYADGERERLGATEHKLFVGSLSKQATEKDVEELFAPYGRIEDVYLLRDDMKQSRGCGFVKFSSREMAAAAINGLNGVLTMRGCEQPLIVRFADPKRPKPGESRGGPTFGGPGFGSQSQIPSTDSIQFEFALPDVLRPTSNSVEPMGGHQPPNSWHSNPEALMLPPQNSAHNFGSQFHPKSGFPAAFPSPGFGGPGNIEATGQSMSNLEKLLPPTQLLPPALQLQQNQQNSAPFSQIQGLQGQFQASHLQASHPNFPSFSQPLSSHQLLSLGVQPPSSQPQVHQSTSGTLQLPPNFQQGLPGVNPQQLTGSAISQLLQLPVQQVPAQMLQQQQQAQALQSSLQVPQLAYSELQQQLKAMQPSNSGQQQNALSGNQQSVSSNVAAPTGIASSLQLNGQAIDIQASLSCSWSEHTSPDGFKYYYNSITKESRWEKPDELIVLEQQQQQQKLLAQQLQSQPQLQTHLHIQSAQQISQVQQVQVPIQPRQQAQLQPSMYQASGVVSNQNVKEFSYPAMQGLGSVIGPTHMPKGPLPVHDWSLANKPAGV